MPTSSGYKVLRSIAAVTASEAAPATTASGWFAPDQFPEADGLEFAFTAATMTGTSPVGKVTLWVRQTVGGAATVIPYKVDAATLTGNGGTAAAVQYANVPPGDWYATLSTVTGTTPVITAKVLVRPYKTPT